MKYIFLFFILLSPSNIFLPSKDPKKLPHIPTDWLHNPNDAEKVTKILTNLFSHSPKACFEWEQLTNANNVQKNRQLK